MSFIYHVIFVLCSSILCVRGWLHVHSYSRMMYMWSNVCDCDVSHHNRAKRVFYFPPPSFLRDAEACNHRVYSVFLFFFFFFGQFQLPWWRLFIHTQQDAGGRIRWMKDNPAYVQLIPSHLLLRETFTVFLGFFFLSRQEFSDFSSRRMSMKWFSGCTLHFSAMFWAAKRTVTLNLNLSNIQLLAKLQIYHEGELF